MFYPLAIVLIFFFFDHDAPNPEMTCTDIYTVDANLLAYGCGL